MVKAKSCRRWRLALAPLAAIVGIILMFLRIAWSDGAPLWWVLRGSHVERVVLKWDKRRIEISNSAQIQQLYEAVLSSSDPLPYPTRCLADEHPENWSVTFVRSEQSPFQIQMGLDGCGRFYVPSVGSTYVNGALLPLVKTFLKKQS